MTVERSVPGGGGSGPEVAVGDQKPAGMSDAMWRDRLCQRLVGCYTFGAPEEPATPPITLRDIASFAPEPGALRSQPSGWGIVDLPVNLLADGGAAERDAVVLGVPVRVRFTPVAYDWSYGDGETRRTETAGAPWPSEFASTGTSHVYGTPGAYDVAVTVRYAAAYSAGAGWIPLEGEIARATPPLRVLVVTARTALTDGVCSAGRAGC